MKTTDFLAGMAVGAGLMYVLDPQQGRRRRALVRDQIVHAGHRIEDEATSHARDLGNRARGAAIGVRQRMSRADRNVDDRTLEARVRSELGRAVSNPGAIAVIADHGRVTLSGPVLEDEASELLSSVRHVPGVREVDDRLEVHQQAGDTPGLQGGH